MAGISQLTGTPWHVERFARQEDDQRRHKSRCVYYGKVDSYCSQVVGQCRGSAHCPYYSETISKKIFDDNNGFESKEKAVEDEEKILYKMSLLFPAGTIVKHKKFGNGIVQNVNNRKITIRFSDENKVLDLMLCAKNSLLTKND